MRSICLNFLTFALSLFYVPTYGQMLDVCEGNPTGDYFPIEIGVKRYYNSLQGSFVNYFNGDTIMVGGKTYFKEVDESGSGAKKESFYRVEKGDVYVYNREKNIEFLELSNIVTIGHSWERQDKSWRYTVIDTAAKLSTPYCDYSQLLNIKAEPLGKAKNTYSSYYNLYYKRGVGQVGVDVEGKGFTFLAIDKSKVEEINYIAPGCEHLTSEQERVHCTAGYISDFIKANFRYIRKFKPGVLVLRFLITQTGEVENVTVDKAIKNADAQTNEAIRVITLMKFTPRKINGVPVKTWLSLPVNF